MNKGILLKYALKEYAAFQENVESEYVDRLIANLKRTKKDKTFNALFYRVMDLMRSVADEFRGNPSNLNDLELLGLYVKVECLNPIRNRAFIEEFRRKVAIVEDLVDNEDPQADRAVAGLKVFVNGYQI
jgi:hypothetical protein